MAKVALTIILSAVTALLTTLILIWTTTASADPFLISDPNDTAEEYLLECPKAWQKNTDYVVGEIVQTPVDPIKLECIEAHNSGDVFNLTHWKQIGTSYRSITPATVDGRVYWDFQLWDKGPGWHDCTVTTMRTYAVEDPVSGVTTTSLESSAPVAVRIKIPNTASSAGHKVTEGN